jgi:hypothetical protein
MQQSSTDALAQFTPCASLVALGCYLQQIQLFAPIRAHVRVAQKTITHASGQAV